MSERPAVASRAQEALQFMGTGLYPSPQEEARGGMGDYQMGGSLRLLTAIEKTEAFSAFLQNRMLRALETQDPTELHYLLAQLDDFHSFIWRYYKKLQQDRGERQVLEE